MLSLPAKRKKEQQGSGGLRLSLPLTGRVWLGLGTAALLAFCLASNLEPQRFTLKPGQIIPQDIRTPAAMGYLGSGKTVKSTEAPPSPAISFVEDRQASLDALEQLDSAIGQLKKARSTTGVGKSIGALQKELPQIPGHLLETLLQVSPEVFDSITRTASGVLALEMAQRPITSHTGDLDLARRDLFDRAHALAPDPMAATGSAALAGAFLRPTVVEKIQSTSGHGVGSLMSDPGFTVVRPGKLLAHKGELASQDLVDELDSLGLNGSPFGPLWRLCLVALSTGSLIVVVVFIRLYRPTLYADTRRLSLLAFIVLAGVAALRFSGYGLGLHFTPSQYGFFALMWVAATAMLMATLVDTEVAVLVSALLSLHTAILLDSQIQFGVAGIFSALAGIYSVRHLRRRSQVLRAAVVLAGVNLISVWVVTIWSAGPMVAHLKIDLGIATIWALGAGIMSPFLYFLGVAVLERLFGITTDLTLLELCDVHQPLLRRLIQEAPGTYAHSLGVANLAEAAAEAIGAETLWVRAGALYHDIGKITRPYFFVENQQGENLHNKLSPTMSAKIITAHISDGVEMAKEHHLPETLIDYIRQHHGTSLVTYFYHQAVITSGTPSGISETAFRYTGPKPQSREAGILMLADCVEGTVRAAMRRNPGRVDAMIARVVQSRLSDGQLSECNLTLREIEQIQTAFTRVLTALHHSRIEYPAAEPVEERWLASASAGR